MLLSRSHQTLKVMEKSKNSLQIQNETLITRKLSRKLTEFLETIAIPMEKKQSRNASQKYFESNLLKKFLCSQKDDCFLDTKQYNKLTKIYSYCFLLNDLLVNKKTLGHFCAC